jgi:uncharacterized membrane protein YkoI
MTHFGNHRGAWKRGLAAALAVALFAVPVAQARPGKDAAAESREMSLDQAVAMAEKRHKARVVRAETTSVDGRRVYVLRLLSEEGRVWTVKVDAATGQER